MKATLRTIAALALSLGLAAPGTAQMQHGGAHGAGHGTPKEHDVDHREHLGDEMHESRVEGFGFYYHLIDNVAQMEQLKEAMKGHDMSQMKPHHLMLYVVDPGGKPVTDARLGFLIRGPGDQEQRTMAAFMEGGYGADVDLKAPGSYVITARVVAGEKNLVDTFEYAVK